MNYIVTVLVQVMFSKLPKGDEQVWVYSVCWVNFS